MFHKVDVLKNFAKFIGKQPRSLFFNEIVGRRSQAYSFIKKGTLAQVEIFKLLKNTCFTKQPCTVIYYTWFCTKYPYLHSPKDFLRNDYIVSLSGYFDSRKIVSIIQEKLPMKIKHLLLVWEEFSTTGRNICKKLRGFMRDFFVCVFCRLFAISA